MFTVQLFKVFILFILFRIYGSKRDRTLSAARRWELDRLLLLSDSRNGTRFVRPNERLAGGGNAYVVVLVAWDRGVGPRKRSLYNRGW
ncbi:MAG: hypothetical protein ABI999_03110 [Acidobacteriota bacterium]